MWEPQYFISCIALRFHTFHCYLIRLILEEIYKAGEVDPRKLPRNFNSLSAKEQVSTLSTTAKQSFLFVCFFLTLIEISARATGLSGSEKTKHEPSHGPARLYRAGPPNMNRL